MKGPVHPAQMTLIAAGIMLSIFFGADLFPILRTIPGMLAAGIKGAAGAAIGLAVWEIYKHAPK